MFVDGRSRLKGVGTVGNEIFFPATQLLFKIEKNILN